MFLTIDIKGRTGYISIFINIESVKFSMSSLRYTEH